MAPEKIADKNSGCKKTIKRLLGDFEGENEKAQRPSHNQLSINTELAFKGELLLLEMVQDSSDPEIEKIYSFLESIFTKEQLVTLDSFKRNIAGKTKNGLDRPKYRVFSVKEKESDNIIAVRVMEQLPVFDQNGNPTNENTLYAIYIAVQDKYRGSTGIAKQMYISSLYDSLLESNKSNKELSSIIAECSDATENLQNAVGLKRVYFQNGNKYEEFPYIQPCMDFDLNTGQAKDTEPKEHFMVYKFDDSNLTKKDLNNLVLSLYKQYKSNLTNSDFKNNEAYNTYLKYFENLEQETINKISSNGEIKLLSKNERKQLEQEGVSITTHKPPKDLD